MRQVKKGSTWHQARDNLKGTAYYGLTETKPTADSSFSIPYNLLLLQETEFLFILGMIFRQHFLDFVFEMSMLCVDVCLA